MKLKELRKVLNGKVAIFNHKGMPIYNDFEKKYPIKLLDEEEVESIIPSDGLVRVKILF